MKMVNKMKKSDIRKHAKTLGYKVQFKTNPFSDKIIAVGFYPPESKKSTIGGNVWSKEFRDQHKEIFDYLTSLDGTILEDTKQKVKF